MYYRSAVSLWSHCQRDMFRIIESNFCRSDKRPTRHKRGRDTRCNVHRVSLIKQQRHDRRSIYFRRIVSSVPVQRHYRSSTTSPSTKCIILPNRIKSTTSLIVPTSLILFTGRAGTVIRVKQAFFNRGLSAARSSNEWNTDGVTSNAVTS